MAKVAAEEKEAYKKKIDELNKKFGAGTIMGGNDFLDEVEVVDTGSLTLNIATGIGGLPVGKLIEMYGPESSGKSTLTLHFIAGQQKAGKRCALVDFEQSFDKGYAKAIGVNIADLFIVQPDSMEDGYNIIEELIKTGEFGFIVLDSHTTMGPKKVVEGEVGDANISPQARINSVALLKIKPLLARNKTTLIGIAQLRTKIGDYGNPDKPTGGNAWKFYSDMRFQVSKVIEKEAETNKTTVKVIKNKCAPPFGTATFPIVWGQGIDRLQEIIDLAVEFDFIKKGGAWFTIDEATKLQGMEAVKGFMLDNPEYKEALEAQVLQKIKEQKENG